MFKLLSDIADSDEAIKALFDHFRNIIICGALFGAAIWKLNAARDQQPLPYFELFIVALLCIVGLILFFVNQFHGIRKLRRSNTPRYALLFAYNAYSLVAVSVLLSVTGIQL